jgi:hypothetical protein
VIIIFTAIRVHDQKYLAITDLDSTCVSLISITSVFSFERERERGS